MPNLTLLSILCIHADETDKDEIYLKVKEKKIWPIKEKFYAIDTDEEASIKLSFNVTSGKYKIDLWEYDYIGKNEILGSFEIETENLGDFSEPMIHAKGDTSYLLNYEIS